MTPQTQATRDALVLGVLANHGGFPISTRTIGDSVHPAGGHQWVLTTLHQLAARGQIERWCVGHRYYWRS